MMRTWKTETPGDALNDIKNLESNLQTVSPIVW